MTGDVVVTVAVRGASNRSADLTGEVAGVKRPDIPLLRANVRRASDEDVEVIAWLALSKHNLTFGQLDLHSDRRDSGKLSLGASFEQRNA